MKKQDRWNEILNIIKIKKEVTVEELAQEFNTSLATIRRDLLEMEENSIITRFHGGARYNTTSNKYIFCHKNLQKQEKHEISCALFHYIISFIKHQCKLQIK